MTKTTFIPEILAPCGSYDILIAAIKAGADACYIGGNKFGARAYAANLDTDSIVRAIDYAHCHDTSLYLTVNTLFKNNEISELYEYLKPYYEAGLDAVIVQDLGVFSMVKKLFPDINIHCSTQMNINSIHAAQFMKNQGATRIVTAREMSLKEITAIKNNVDIEIETFVHGAMCYSYSGQCLMSSFAGGRSGNRGRCAQPCRKCYDDSFVLSMKDMCALEHIPEIVDAGIDSLKIEGRMKNEYYVASAVDAYKELCNDYIQGSFSKEKANKYKFKLANIYNRGGFCDGYFFTHNGLDMISINRPNNQGVMIGRINNISDGKIQIKLQNDLYKGDVLELKLKNNEILEITSGVDGKTGSMAWLNAPKTRQIIYKQDVLRTRCNYILDQVAQDIYNYNKIPVDGVFEGIVGNNMSFTVRVNHKNKCYTYTATGNVTEKSMKRPASKEDILEKLTQMGDTDYIANDITIKISDNSFIPASVVKNLRREALDGLNKTICENYRRKTDDNICNIDFDNDTYRYNSKSSKVTPDDNKAYTLNVGVKSIEQLKEVICYDFIAGIYIEKELYLEASKEGIIDKLKSQDINIYMELPYIINASFDLEKHLQNTDINGIYIRNIDGFACVTKHTNNQYRYIAGSSLYAYNNEAVSFWNQFIPDMTYELPKELNSNELKGLSGRAKELVIYEHQQVMLSAQCITKTMYGCNHNNDTRKITDDKGNVFYAKSVCAECCNIILNGTALYIIDKMTPNLLSELQVESFRINFTIEDSDKVSKVLCDYKKFIDDKNHVDKTKGRYTSGHFNRGVD